MTDKEFLNKRRHSLMSDLIRCYRESSLTEARANGIAAALYEVQMLEKEHETRLAEVEKQKSLVLNKKS